MGGGGQGDGTGEGDKGMGHGGGGRGLAQGEQLSCKKTETVMFTDHQLEFDRTFHKQIRKILTINVPVVYMGRYKVVLRGDYP